MGLSTTPWKVYWHCPESIRFRWNVWCSFIRICLAGLPIFISVGVAGAVYQYILEHGKEQSMKCAREVLLEISGLEETETLMEYILPIYQLYLEGVSIREIRQFAEGLRKEEQKEVI